MVEKECGGLGFRGRVQSVEKDNTPTMPVEKTEGSTAGFIANDRRVFFKFGQGDCPSENGRKARQRAL